MCGTRKIGRKLTHLESDVQMEGKPEKPEKRWETMEKLEWTDLTESGLRCYR